MGNDGQQKRLFQCAFDKARTLQRLRMMPRSFWFEELPERQQALSNLSDQLCTGNENHVFYSTVAPAVYCFRTLLFPAIRWLGWHGPTNTY